MPRFASLRVFVICLSVSLGGSATFARSAHAEAYAGALIGIGIPMGIDGLENGMVYGATLGAHVLPLFSIAATYLHDGFETTFGGFDTDVDQFLAEANFFSLFFMNAGIHAGAVTTKFLGSSQSDLGFGAHLGFDLKLVDRFSVGAAGYWTYVQADDKYSTLNLMVPLKVYF